jgi:hypothetical protein
MRARLIILVCGFSLAACQQRPDARITSVKPVAPAPKVAVKARSEPIFYNGKNYQFSMSPATNGIFDLAVDGMSAKQEKEAVAVGTSSLRYFACKDTQDSKLTGKASYSGGQWRMQARCV